MILRKLRLKHGWSQEHLAHISGLSVRTIQRIERGQTPSLESKKSLASVFEVDIATFDTEVLANDSEQVTPVENKVPPPLFNDGENTMNTDASPSKIEAISKEEKSAIQYVKGIKEFYSHLLLFIVFAVVLFIKKHPENPMIVWAIIGWGVGVVIHGLNAYEKLNFFTPNWEKKQVEKRLGKKL